MWHKNVVLTWQTFHIVSNSVSRHHFIHKIPQNRNPCLSVGCQNSKILDKFWISKH